MIIHCYTGLLCLKLRSFHRNVMNVWLINWLLGGNVFMGAPPPDNFYEVMEAASEVTGAFTSTECSDAADRILAQRKRNLH